MKIKKQNIFLILFVISYVVVFPFVFVEMYKNSGLGELFAASDKGGETQDAFEIIDNGEDESGDIIETPPATSGEDTTTPPESTVTNDVTKDSDTEKDSSLESTSEQETLPAESTTETTPDDTLSETTSQQEPETTTNTLEIPSEFPITQEETSEQETTTEGEIKLQFMTVEPSYFDDALFIGDSRTVGIYEYGVLDSADFFCNVGMSVYSVHKAEVNVPSVGKTTLTKLLETGKYGKIYIMLGMNELGYSFNKTVQKYGELLNEIRSLQPDAVIYLQANLHVTKKRSDSDAIYNNQAINRFNQAVADYADNESIFYIDVNTLFDDEEGNFDKIYTNDNTHPFARYYTEWSKWLCEMVVIR